MVSFSQPVVDRASALLKNYVGLPLVIGTEVIWAIAHLDFQREVREEMRVFPSSNPESLPKHDRFITEQEQLLLRHWVTDDLTAIAYIDKVEPILKGYLVQYQELQQRHASELDELLQSFV